MKVNYVLYYSHFFFQGFLIIDELLRTKHNIDKTNYELESNQSKMLAHYIFCVCKNHGIFLYSLVYIIYVIVVIVN